MPTTPTPSQAPTVAIETHGCKLNQADSLSLASSFANAGFRVVDDDETPDVYLVNTCTVTHVADRKARQALRAARRRNPDALVVATGCYAQRAPQRLRELDEVDLVLGNTEKATLVERIVRSRKDALGPCATGVESEAAGFPMGRTRAMVKIQEGCDQVCAYCIVPKVRGRERSIPPAAIVGRINEHAAAGYKEVVLTGTQLGSYGFDLPDIDLTRLLSRILRETEVPRIRVSSVQPQELTSEMLELWSDPRLCPHFHLALQSGSDAVLGRMRRRYTVLQYLEVAEAARRGVPDAAITTDVIVGFPGETDADFSKTQSVCEKVGFAGIHVFPYSARPGTSAAHFDGGIDPHTKAVRVQQIQSQARDDSAGFRQRFLGTTREVLWEKPGGDNGALWTGLTDNYIRVEGRSTEILANKITRALLQTQKEDLVVSQVLS